jgi:sigma-B regulation protein RsbU (phosphoserine phosphatase)
VCGKGVEAAKAAALARHTIGAAAMQRSSPADVLALLNETFHARNAGSELFLTAIYGTLRMGENDCIISLACAGHPVPVLRRADGTVSDVAISGPLIGVFPQLDWRATTMYLNPGDALTLYTDGVNEARRGGELFGDARVRDVIAALPLGADAQTIAAALESAALDFAGGVATDDIAVLVLRVPPPAD